ncbi:right-handed parallel beta-helix repeat-containing protein [Bradyrhizobium prioriisuperbiae]|uniref:right-handed parallel beta-helix repeat-containing protein n=1 Tax=Bradyrhizobium prioriisuperbiae TaxID=2854389 RepID=UPI0028F114A6|nr:right-handed parallel beta-helix repeat-containing protein [Bradyrhizobium prioritasuperba]
MKKFALSFLAAVGAVLAVASYAAPAHAQATRTWVSGVGDDVNPCSRTAPCKTFAGAISKTATAGEINCLDSGGFGAVTITKSISILCEGVIGGILAAGTNGVIVNAAGAEVLLSGLDIEGFGTGLNGVRVLNAATVTIRNCSLRNFTQRGVNLEGPANTRVYLQDSQIISNTLGGFHMQGAGGAANNAFIERTTFDLNPGTAIDLVGPGQVILSGNTVGFSPTSVAISAGATTISYGNNIFRTAAAITQTLAHQ